MVFVYTAMGVLCVGHANVLELCYIELLSGDGSPYSILSANTVSESLTRRREHTIIENLFILKKKQHNGGYRISQTGKGTVLQLQRWDRRQPFICGYFPENLHENDSRKERTCSGCHFGSANV